MAKRKFWTSDRIVSLSAMFISIITLFIFIRQTNIIERQSKLSAMPYLMINMSNNAYEKIISLDVVNHGLGPAIIESTTMYYNGKKYDMSVLDFLKTQIKEIDSVEIVNVTRFSKGLAIPNGDKFNIITAGGSEKGYKIFKKAASLLVSNEFEYKIVYKSVYNDRWLIDSKSEVPKSLN